jgi:hypothetical protein
MSREQITSSPLQWRKSSYSGSDGGDCVEVAAATHLVHVRDSKDVTRPGFAVSPAGWTSFAAFAANQENAQH